MSGQHPLMTAGEVAAAFRVTPTQVARWRKSGKLSAVRMPADRGYRFFRAEVAAWLNGQPLTSEQVTAARHQVMGGDR